MEEAAEGNAEEEVNAHPPSVLGALRLRAGGPSQIARFARSGRGAFMDGMAVRYDRIGAGYASTRQADPRIAAVILDALGDARSVLNVGAGAGSYEPSDREVLAVEPSATMIAQRPAGAARVIQASAEALPLPDRSFDAALAVNTIHHWDDVRAGLRELRRVVRRRVVIFLRHPQAGTPFWLTEEYLPALDVSVKNAALAEVIGEELPSVTTRVIPLPRDATDGVFAAYWGRPERYLDPEVRQHISNFALAGEEAVAEGLGRLREDLASGAWDRKHGSLRTLGALDLGHRVFVAEVGAEDR